MQTVPERRPSGDREEPAVGAPSLSAEGEKLKVVPKVRIEPREKVFADQVFRGLVVFCALAVMAVVGLIIFELLRESRPLSRANEPRVYGRTDTTWVSVMP